MKVGEIFVMGGIHFSEGFLVFWIDLGMDPQHVGS